MSTIDTIRKHPFSPAPSTTAGYWPRVPGFNRVLANMAKRLGTMLVKHRSRRILRDLTDDQLRDIGVSRAAAMREAGRPFWS